MMRKLRHREHEYQVEEELEWRDLVRIVRRGEGWGGHDASVRYVPETVVRLKLARTRVIASRGCDYPSVSLRRPVSPITLITGCTMPLGQIRKSVRVRGHLGCWPYSSSVTCLPQVTGLPESSASCIATWTMNRSGAAPCQWS